MKDFLLDDDNDLLIENGDIFIGEADEQNMKLLLMLEKGSLKEFPDCGVGLFSFLESEDQQAMLTEIRRQFATDGINVKAVGFDNEGKLKIDAGY